jgi:uncharacterized protein YkwD
MSWLDWLLGLLGRPKPKPTPGPGPAPTPDSAGALLAATNAARAQAKLPPLRIDPRLQAMAASYAAELAKAGVLTHGDFAARLEASGYPYRTAGENLAFGQASAQAATLAWLADPAHRANLLGAFTDCGLSGARSSSGVPYWVADYTTQKS